MQVLSVTEARARTFDHLFLIGLNRDVFPRGIREDPLLPDDLRRILQRVLPDVPIKRAGFDEERYLFAQLLSAAPAVTLSWQTADDDGKPLPASPLVERLREPAGRREGAAALEPARSPAPCRDRAPAAEHAVMAGLHAPRRWWGRVMKMALQESRAELARSRLRPFAGTARHRPPRGAGGDGPRPPHARRPGGARPARPLLRLRRQDPRRRPRGEPRLRDLYVTQLENLAACPWQLFLVRLLRIEPTPDPLGALPGVTPCSSATWSTARSTRSPGRPGREGVRGGGLRHLDPAAVAWPEGRDVDQLLFEEASAAARRGGDLPPRPRPRPRRAGPADAGDGARHGLVRRRRARAGDRGGGDARRRRTPPARCAMSSSRRTASTRPRAAWWSGPTTRPAGRSPRPHRPDVRRRHFLDRVRKGTHLQAVAYLLGSEGEAEGRYLFLKPGLDDGDRELAVTTADEDFIEAFAAASDAVLAAWESGSFFPRLVDLDGRNEPVRCGFCAVAEACLRHDSGARQRLFEWTERDLAALSPEEASLLRVWRLGVRRWPREPYRWPALPTPATPWPPEEGERGIERRGMS